MSANPYLPRLRAILTGNLAEPNPDVKAARIALRHVIADMAAEMPDRTPPITPTPTPVTPATEPPPTAPEPTTLDTEPTSPVTPPTSPVEPPPAVVTVSGSITLDELFRRIKDATTPGTTYVLEIES